MNFYSKCVPKIPTYKIKLLVWKIIGVGTRKILVPFLPRSVRIVIVANRSNNYNEACNHSVENSKEYRSGVTFYYVNLRLWIDGTYLVSCELLVVRVQDRRVCGKQLYPQVDNEGWKFVCIKYIYLAVLYNWHFFVYLELLEKKYLKMKNFSRKKRT